MRIVNLRTYRGEHVYCGRKWAGRPASPLGNPFKGDGAMDRYRCWLWKKIDAADPDVMGALNALTADSVLGCWCVPGPCHCEVIVRAWEWLQKTTSESPAPHIA